jgi:uncharacterized membrane protein YphA (DoxX/SURF4 family)
LKEREMSKAMNIYLASGNDNSKRGQRRSVTIVLWIVQVLVALLFLFAGSMKLIMPIEMMTAQMAVPLPGLFMQFIGVAEVLGAIGLILPGTLRIQRGLTPLAAYGLLIIMVGATVVTILGGDVASAMVPAVVGLLCVGISTGRRSWGLENRRVLVGARA